MEFALEQDQIKVPASGQIRARDAARFTGHSERTLANWRTLGRGPSYVKRGGRVFYPLDVLKQWVAGVGK